MLPKPATNKQAEARITRLGNKTNSIYRYLTTGTNWERYAFASVIAARTGSTENLGMGDAAQHMRDAFVQAYEDADEYPPHAGEGVGGKAFMQSLERPHTPFEKARAYYYGQLKNTRTRQMREGVDYYATPEPLGQKMVDWANIAPHEHTLEPSAGHGAIARWFPENVSRTVIEPNEDLASRAALAAPGARVMQTRFELLHKNNKYDAIVMNPPFGQGGKTAADHLALATSHLRNGGRIVALIPDGPAMGKRFDSFMESPAAKDVYHVATIDLPRVTFERAGSNVKTRVVVLEKQTDPEVAGQLQQVSRDYSDAKTTKAFFDQIEHSEIPPRLEPRTKDQAAAPEGAADQGVTAEAEPEAPQEKGPFTTSDEGGRFVAKPTGKVENDVWRARNTAATRYGGEYQRGVGSWHFAGADQRDAFVKEATTGEASPHLMAGAGAAPGQGTQLGSADAYNEKYRRPTYVATKGANVDDDEFGRLRRLASEHGGYWSAFKVGRAVPGFQFETAEARDAFIQAAGGQAPPAGRLMQANPTRRGFLAGAAASPLAVAVRPEDRAPLHDSVEAMVRQEGGAKAADVASMIARTSKNPAYRALAQRLSGLLGDARMHVTDQAGELDDLGETSVFDRGPTKTGDISLFHSTDTPDTGLTEETALHEMIHSAVVQRYAGVSLYDEHNRELVRDPTKRGADEAVGDFRDLWSGLTNAIDTNKGGDPSLVPDHVANSPGFDEFMRSPDEALAWSMTNPDLQAWLKTVDEKGNRITDPGRTSAWSKIVDFVRGLLGMKPGGQTTALEKLLDAGNTLLTRAQLDQPDRAFSAKLDAEQTREQLQNALQQKAKGARQAAGVPPPATPQVGLAPRSRMPQRTPKEGGPIERLASGVDDLFAKAKPHLDRMFPDTGEDNWRSLPHSLASTFSPLSRGAEAARGAIKSFANLMREATFTGAQLDRWIAKNFTPKQQEAMYDAVEEESLAAVQKRTLAPGQGLDRLTPVERDAVTKLIAASNRVWGQLQQYGVVKGDGLPSWVPRMLVALNAHGELEALRGKRGGKNTAEIGSNLTTWAGHLMPRKGETISDTELLARQINPTAKVVRNIRTLNLATTRSTRIVLQKMLMNHLKTSLASAGVPAMIDHADPAYETIGGHPAFTQWHPNLITDPKTGKTRPLEDEFGNKLPDMKQLYLHKSLMPGMKAVLSSRDPHLVRALSAVKAAQMNLLLFSPATHMQVIWGGAFGLAPGKMAQVAKPYLEGFKARNDPDTMSRALRAGLQPPSQAGAAMPDIAGIAEDRQITPGHGPISKAAGGLVGLANKGAGQFVSTKLDQLGSFLHNTLLWDKVASLQMGLFTHMSDQFQKQGLPPTTADITAAHLANRAVGMIPPESMSALSRMASNIVFFARNFTLNNLARIKDVFRGLPGEVQAQIKSEDGAAALRRAQGIVRTRSAGALAIDYAMAHLMAATLAAMGQGVYRAITGPQDDTPLTLDPRMTQLAHAAAPYLGGGALSRALAGAEANEPGKEDHMLLYRKPDGTNVYVRNPVGHTEADLSNWLTKFPTTFRSKESPVVGWADAFFHNDRGFGRKLYDDTRSDPGTQIKNAARIGADLVRRSVPTGEFNAIHDMVTGGGDGRGPAALSAALGLLGFTTSQGHPLGTAEAVSAKQQSQYDFDFEDAKDHARPWLVQARAAEAAGDEATHDRLQQQATDYFSSQHILDKDAAHYIAAFDRAGPSRGQARRAAAISARFDAGVPAQ
jgi:hypothetical protein